LRFEEDLNLVCRKLEEDLDFEDINELRKLKEKLLKMYKQQLVKSNHSVMELIVAKYFLTRGWKVDVEHRLTDVLVCDVYCENDNKIVIVEVETGFVPPENAVDPITYRLARIISKTARYSPFADEFYLATPGYHILQIPQFFLISPSEREKYDKDAKTLKALCDRYYSKPPVSIEELVKARIDGIILLNVDKVKVKLMKLHEYYDVFLMNLRKLGMYIEHHMLSTSKG